MTTHDTDQTYPWPDGARGALCVTFDLDGESPHLWRTRDQRPPGVAELEQRRYGPRRGVHRLLAMLRRLEITSTFFVPGWIAETYPDAVRAVHDDGHEIALHGWLHEPPTEIGTDRLVSTLERATERLVAITGTQPTGYRSPSWQMTPETLEVVADLGLRYDSSLMGDDRPYLVGEPPGSPLVEVPVDWATDDAPYYRYAAGDVRPPALPHALVGAWRDEVEAAVTHGSLCMLTMHPFLSGRPARLLLLERLLAEAVERDDLHVTTVDALARHHLRVASDLGVGTPRSVDWPEVRS